MGFIGLEWVLLGLIGFLLVLRRFHCAVLELNSFFFVAATLHRRRGTSTRRKAVETQKKRKEKENTKKTSPKNVPNPTVFIGRSSSSATHPSTHTHTHTHVVFFIVFLLFFMACSFAAHRPIRLTEIAT